ncbi:MAG TPA: ABC transporter permease subunit [Terriglobales bacterium]|nr:ABC transporter permease subunit [Terriglobales bacterium]
MSDTDSTRRAGRQRRRYAFDDAAKVVVTAGGLAVILSIAALLAFIAVEVAPLWRTPTAREVAVLSGDRGWMALRYGGGSGLLTAVTADGEWIGIPPQQQGPVFRSALPSAPPVVAASHPEPESLYWVTADGALHAGKIRTAPGSTSPSLQAAGSWPLAATGVSLLAVAGGEGRMTAVVAGPQRPPSLLALTQPRTLFGRGEAQEQRAPLPLDSGQARALDLSEDGDAAYVATSDGFLYRWSLQDPAKPLLAEKIDVTGRRDLGLSALALMSGSRTVISGDESGSLAAWSLLADAASPGGFRLVRTRDFESLGRGVVAIVPSPRDKRFAAASQAGAVRMYQATTGQGRQWLQRSGSGATALAFAPKGDGLLLLDGEGWLRTWTISDPHPEVSWRALFGKVWYEGYSEPAHVWQSTGGTDDFEPKLSLVPLIVGTMKGTLYSLLFAAPIAILAALYTSQFSHPRLRAVIKPTVEIMAALPSVVLGFLAGLWLAPALEHRIPALMAMLLVSPLLIFAAAICWQAAPQALRRRLSSPGAELLPIVLLLVISAWVSFAIGPQLEDWLFQGDFRHWLVEHGGRLDQRNSLVVAFALGFAVIPVIFTIAEDALSNVPQRLVSASLALGATRWQTALRVVMPTASAGIFSAVMIGFGRAVGETMIVLMATGNTPVLDWSLFTGMRTLSANIAVEIPEAPFGGTLYRVLFLAALLLFLTTFTVNTAAELIRQRLRRKYQSL